MRFWRFVRILPDDFSLRRLLANFSVCHELLDLLGTFCKPKFGNFDGNGPGPGERCETKWRIFAKIHPNVRPEGPGNRTKFSVRFGIGGQCSGRGIILLWLAVAVSVCSLFLSLHTSRKSTLIRKDVAIFVSGFEFVYGIMFFVII